MSKLEKLAASIKPTRSEIVKIATQIYLDEIHAEEERLRNALNAAHNEVTESTKEMNDLLCVISASQIEKLKKLLPGVTFSTHCNGDRATININGSIPLEIPPKHLKKLQSLAAKQGACNRADNAYQEYYSRRRRYHDEKKTRDYVESLLIKQHVEETEEGKALLATIKGILRKQLNAPLQLAAPEVTIEE